MNKPRRAALAKAAELLREAYAIIEEAYEDEQNAYDNMPESLQYSERGEQMEEYIYDLETALEVLDETASRLEEIAEV